MAIKILFFGQLTELTGITELIPDEKALTDIKSLREYLNVNFPGLKEHNFRISVNGKISATGNLRFNDNDEIGLLPPFAGG